jgi:hypothetical protein
MLSQIALSPYERAAKQIRDALPVALRARCLRSVNGRPDLKGSIACRRKKVLEKERIFGNHGTDF